MALWQSILPETELLSESKEVALQDYRTFISFSEKNPFKFEAMV